MRNIVLAAAVALASTGSLAGMMGGPGVPISTTAYFPLVDGARYDYMFARGPWSSATAEMHTGQTWAGVQGLTAMHTAYTCAAGVQCAPDATDFYRMDPDGMHYFGGTGSDPDGHHYSMTMYTNPEWPLQNPVTPGTMMGGGMYQNMGQWSAGVSGSGNMMGSVGHMSQYQAMALETVTTPAGTFANALHIREQRGPGDLRDVWYAENVGMVMMIDGAATMMLSGYTIPGGVTQAGGQPPLAFTPTTGMWWNSSESGSGYNIQVRHGMMVVTMFMYGTGGEPMWYLGTGALTNAAGGVTASGTLDKYFGGQCAACNYRPPSAAGNDGAFAMTFSSPDSGVLQLPGGRTVPIVPMPW